MTPLTTLILATDDRALARALQPLLAGVDILTIGDPGELESLRHGQTWCFVDWILRATSGLEVCRLLRTGVHTAHAHITAVLEDLESDTRRRVLKCGADDYVLGPLSAALIIERIERLAPGQVAPYPSERLKAGQLELDPNAHRLWFQGTPVPLQPRQFALMSFLMRHPNRVYSRDELLMVLGPKGEMADVRTVDAWVARLRRDLRHSGAPDPLRTVRDYGYVLDAS